MSLEGMQLGRYRLLRLIGSGGMGEVYLADDPSLHRQVAIKVIRTDSTEQDEEADVCMRFSQREAQAVAALDHSLILPLYDYGETQVQGATFAYLVMPYREDGSLADWIQQRQRTGVLTIQDVEHIAKQAASALQYAHDHQIIHLDVKPSNFLLRYDAGKQQRPDLLLADFGVAKLAARATRTNQSVRGTPTYMAPELWQGHPTPATDQYALAVMLYELLTGSAPFHGNIMQLMYAHLHTMPSAPSSVDSRLPASIDDVLLRGLAKQPTQRFPSVMAFVNALQLALASLDPSMPVGTIPGAQAGGKKPVNTPDIASSRQPIRATLAISAQEALSGGKRDLSLPDGRRISVVIPAGVQDGQVIRVDDPHMTGDTNATQLYLMLTVVNTPPLELNTGSMDSGKTTAQDIATVIHTSQAGATFEQRPTLPNEPQKTLAAAQTQTPSNVGTFVAAQPSRPQRTRRPVAQVALFGAIIVLLLISSGGLYYYFGVAHAGGGGGGGDHLTGTPSINGQQQTATAYVYETATATAFANSYTPTVTSTVTTPTASVTGTANGNPYPPYSGTLVMNDPLQNNNAGYQWDVNKDATVGAACQFENGAYDITMPTHYGGPCFARNTNYTNFTYEVQMTFLQVGPSFSGGGLVFRSDGNKYYVFEIFESGRYSFYVCVGYDCSKALAQDLTNPIPSFHIGLNQPNRIAVVAQGNTFVLYVNGQLVKGNIVDSANTSSQGMIGLFCEGSQAVTVVAYNDAKVWA